MNLTNNTNSTTNAFTQLISRVIDKYDTNNDGSLGTAEFGNFLSGLLDGSLATSNAAAGDTAPTAPIANDPTRVTTGMHRARLAGFDFGKLENPAGPGGGTMKYISARIFQDYPPQPESLPAVVERLRAQGINATQVSFDKIDYNDGYGPIDVIQGAYPGGGVAWQWLPQSEM